MGRGAGEGQGGLGKGPDGPEVPGENGMFEGYSRGWEGCVGGPGVAGWGSR